MRRDFTDTGMVRALDPAICLTWWRRFQSRLLAYLLGLSCISSAVAGGIYYTRQVKFVRAEQTERGKTLLSNLAGQSELGTYSGDSTFLTVPLRRVFQESDVNYATIYNGRGETLARLVKPEVKVDPRLPPDVLRALLDDPSAGPIRHTRREHEDLFAPVVTVQGDPEEGLFGAEITRDQTMAAVVEGEGVDTKEAGRVHHVLASAVGAQEMTPSIGLIDLAPGDILLLCTDGLTKHVSDEAIARLLVSDLDPGRVSDRLVEAALEGGGSDNVTVIVARADS